MGWIHCFALAALRLPQPHKAVSTPMAGAALCGWRKPVNVANLHHYKLNVKGLILLSPYIGVHRE